MSPLTGKTKTITPLTVSPHIGRAVSTNNLSAFDGEKRAVMTRKAEWATDTTCNVFEHLTRKTSVPLAYVSRGDTPDSFFTKICTMIPVEIVVRFEAQGSYCARNPGVAPGTSLVHHPDHSRLFESVVEFFYKTSGREINGLTLPCDDPLIEWNGGYGGFDLYHPKKPKNEGYIGLLPITDSDAEKLRSQLPTLERIADATGSCLFSAWRDVGGKLQDIKIECGELPSGEIVLADVIDCDSWRVKWHGIQISKQEFRDDKPMEIVSDVYALGASLTRRFLLL